MSLAYLPGPQPHDGRGQHRVSTGGWDWLHGSGGDHGDQCDHGAAPVTSGTGVSCDPWSGHQSSHQAQLMALRRTSLPLLYSQALLLILRSRLTKEQQYNYVEPNCWCHFNFIEDILFSLCCWEVVLIQLVGEKAH